MYIRTTQRKNKDGSIVRYVQLAYNQRDPKTKTVKAKVVHNFGREDELDVEALRRLARSIARYLGPEEDLRLQAEQSGLRFLKSRPVGGAWLLNELWHRLEIGSAVREHCGNGVERLVFAMVANRALAPKSKLAVEEWSKYEAYLPGVAEIAVHQLYRAMDVLLEKADLIQREIFSRVARSLFLEVDLLFFDTTSTYFETDEEDPETGRLTLRKRGHSKDHRPDLPQVLIGLAVTREGIPIRCWVWPGKTSDVEVIPQVKKDLTDWRLGRVITVLDRGFMSEDNLPELQKAGGHYIIGERMRSGKPHVEEALSRRGRYREIRENLQVKEIEIGDGERRIRYILARNPIEAERQKRLREKALEELRAELRREPSAKRICELVAHQTYGRYLKLGANSKVEIDPEKVRREERLDGKYLIRTSDDTLTAADVALGYKQLLEVEDAFRTLKTHLELRPVYHRLSDRIRAHVLLCWMALLLVRVAEVEAETTWPRLRDILQRIHAGEMVGSEGRFVQRTEITAEQKAVFKVLKVVEPPLVLEAEVLKRT